MVHYAAQKGYMLVKKSCFPVLFALVMLIFLNGCLALHTPVELPTYTNGATVNALSSNASLSYTSPERSVSGSGYLMYRKPDQMRMVVLSPFGSVLQEIYAAGGFITIVDTGNGVAFSGGYADLPEKGDFSGWRHIQWLTDIDPSDSSRGSAVIERMNRFGEKETAVFEKGLLVSKTVATAGRVSYCNYTAVNGVAFPLEITYETAAKEKFVIQLEEPEINVPFADNTFTPNLSKLRVYPLSVLK